MSSRACNSSAIFPNCPLLQNSIFRLLNYGCNSTSFFGIHLCPLERPHMLADTGSDTLKTAQCQYANFMVIGGIRCCRNDKRRCHQWQQSWYHGSWCQCFVLSDAFICVSTLTIIGSDNSLSPGRLKPLSEPMLEYCWLDPHEQTSVES